MPWFKVSTGSGNYLIAAADAKDAANEVASATGSPPPMADDIQEQKEVPDVHDLKKIEGKGRDVFIAV